MTTTYEFALINCISIFISGMGFIFTTIRTGVKVGLAGTAVYGAHYYGFTGSADQAEKGVKAIKTDFYEILPQYIPKEVLENVPEIPKVDLKDVVPTVEFEFNLDARGLWNKGVLAAFGGLANSPNSVKGYSNDLVTYLGNQLNESSTSAGESVKKVEESTKKPEGDEDCGECKKKS